MCGGVIYKHLAGTVRSLLSSLFAKSSVTINETKQQQHVELPQRQIWNALVNLFNKAHTKTLLLFLCTQTKRRESHTHTHTPTLTPALAPSMHARTETITKHAHTHTLHYGQRKRNANAKLSLMYSLLLPTETRRSSSQKNFTGF